MLCTNCGDRVALDEVEAHSGVCSALWVRVDAKGKSRVKSKDKGKGKGKGKGKVEADEAGIDVRGSKANNALATVGSVAAGSMAAAGSTRMSASRQLEAVHEVASADGRVRFRDSESSGTGTVTETGTGTADMMASLMGRRNRTMFETSAVDDARGGREVGVTAARAAELIDEALGGRSRGMAPLSREDVSRVLHLTQMPREEIDECVSELFRDGPGGATRTRLRELVMRHTPDLLSAGTLQVVVEAIIAETGMTTQQRLEPIWRALAPLGAGELASQRVPREVVAAVMQPLGVTTELDDAELPRSVAALRAMVHDVLAYTDSMALDALESALPSIQTAVDGAIRAAAKLASEAKASALLQMFDTRGRINGIMERLRSQAVDGCMTAADAAAMARALGSEPADEYEAEMCKLHIVEDSLLALLEWESEVDAQLDAIEAALSMTNAS
ncbi:uncharacterized protein AMSG_06471 [Thecamonas trahens ATCC 50062]|uniref:Uncharacterized protein n=1 Tax=Thecamonas trahens ATCC 50062 TaxID=461836 RepID=A0A0L0DFQ9_THETB|nr:hypothetical protein AMSG_06471 [Thecamonas trahens ATCC 50062]KNC51124.1 hypothetical protein AMSG_06471 [Thecamonas trahens ATCC 50062]|eukprot:XP_013756332.1 hypothetical protein AMSG_06471 [Thecamonas trahens ATCC 50062]